MRSNWNKENSIWKNFFLWGWSNTNTGCPEKMWSLHPWSYSKPDWTQPPATCCSWLCFKQVVGPGDLQRCLPASGILWFSSLRQWVLACSTAPPSEFCPFFCQRYTTLGLTLTSYFTKLSPNFSNLPFWAPILKKVYFKHADVRDNFYNTSFLIYD